MKTADKDNYFDDIVIKPVDQESQREIEFITLDMEVKDAVDTTSRERL